jgi:hypothetical protein
MSPPLGPRPAAALAALAIALVAAPRRADAQQACIALLRSTVRPAAVEWTGWIGGGGGVRGTPPDPVTGDERARGMVVARAGLGATLGLATLGRGGHGGDYELRWGPWFGGELQPGGALVEGGLELLFTQTRHARWGTYALRVGAAVGDATVGDAPHLSITLTGGVRPVVGREVQHGACDPTPPRRIHGWASGARLFVTVRGPADDDHGIAVVSGLELEPSFLFPPYSVERLIGSAE